MNPVRILQVTTIMNTGGIETLLMNIYRNIDRSKIQFDFLVHRKEKGFYDDEILSLGGKIYNVPPINPFRHKHYLNELDEFFHTHNYYQIVHSHLNTLSTFPLRAAMNAGIPIRIAHSHIAYPKLDYKAPFKLYSKSKLKRYCTHLFACSNLAGQWLYGKTNNDFTIIKNAVQAEKFQYNQNVRERVRKEFSIESKLVLGHIGRFSSQKNHLFLLEVFKAVYEQNPNTVLLLVGEGKLRERIEKKINELGLNDNVILTGVRSDIPELLQAMDVFVFPSLFEGLPVTLIEAQAAGLPCIVSDKVTTEVSVTNLIKYISLKSTPKVWATEILNLYKRSHRENKYSQIVDSGYDMRIMATQLQNFYLKKVWSSL